MIMPGAATACIRSVSFGSPVASCTSELRTKYRASTAQIQRAVAAVLGLTNVPEPHDVADAIAIAMTGLRLRAAAERVREAVS